MNNLKEAYNIFSKLDFKQFPTNAVISPFKDGNQYTEFNWQCSDVSLSTTELVIENGIKFINFKTPNSKIFSTDNTLTNINSNLKTSALQVEMLISVPTFKTNNIFFNIASNSGQGFMFNIKSNRLEITCNGKTIICACNFVENVVYNIMITKKDNTYIFAVDGKIVGKITSLEFTNNINANVSSFTIGASQYSYTTNVSEFVGKVANINMSYGNYLKYNIGFSKYADQVLSSYNFKNVNPNTTALYYCDLETLVDPSLVWEYENPITSVYGEYYINNNTFKSAINDIFTIKFEMRNAYKNDAINIADFGDIKIGYKLEHINNNIPDVIVDEYTTSALNFETQLTDKIPTTIWESEGTATVEATNVIYSDFSFETINANDSLKTGTDLISKEKFTIDFTCLLKNQTVDNLPLFIKSSDIHGKGQGLYVTNKNFLEWYRNSLINDDSGIDLIGNYKVNVNEVNNYTISFDGAALRGFVNGKLDFVSGDTVGIKNTDLPYRFLRNNIPSTSYNTWTLGILDNINVFDGVANKVREKGEYDEFLSCDLEFIAPDTSTKFIDNGKDKFVWSVNGTANITTINPFKNKFSAANFDGGANNIGTSLALGDSFSIEFMFKTPSKDDGYHIGLLDYGNGSLGGNGFNVTWSSSQNIWWRSHPNTNIPSQTLSPNTIYKILLTYDKGEHKIYVNDVLSGSGNGILQTNDVKSFNVGYANTDWKQTNLYQMNYFKLYKGIAIVPKSNATKINLKFNNNLDDEFNNSVWTNVGNVEYDDVNSTYGKSIKITTSGQRLTTTSSALNFENKSFELNYDIANNQVNGGAYYSMTNNLASTASGSIWIAASNTYWFDYKDKPSATSEMSLPTILRSTGVYFNKKFIRKNNVLSAYYNDVICGTHNLTTQNFNFTGGGYACIGMGENFGGSSSFIGNMDNFYSLKEDTNTEKVVVKNEKPAVLIPFESAFSNHGYVENTNVNYRGSPTYETFKGVKATKFTNNNYVEITNHNIFNLNSKCDFYIEFDFAPLQDRYHVMLSNGTVTTSNNTLVALSLANATFVDSNGVAKPYCAYIYCKDGSFISTTNGYTMNEWNNIKVYRIGDKVSINLNGVITTVTSNHDLDFSFLNTFIARQTYGTTAHFEGYMANFKMFVGSGVLPETYNDKAVLNINFSPTNKSYLFKDKNNKCLLHPINIKNRAYKSSSYCCEFDGTSKYIQLGKNNLLNLNKDDFVMRIKMRPNDVNSANLNYSRVFAPAQGSPMVVDYIMYTGQQYNIVDLRGVLFFVLNEQTNVYLTSNKLPFDSVTTIDIVRDGEKFYLYQNDVLVNSNIYTGDINFNRNNNTLIGASIDPNANSVNMYYHGDLHQIKLLRNTSDKNLLDDVDENGEILETFNINDKIITFDKLKKHDVQITSDIDKLTLRVDEKSIDVNKVNPITNISLFNGYNGGLKTLSIYKNAFYDEDSYIGSDLIETQYPDIKIINDTQGLVISDVGEYILSGFIEGYTDRNYRIYNINSDAILLDGIEDYYYNGLDVNYIDEYYILDLVNGTTYPVNKHEMVKGYIGGSVNLKNCGVKFVDMKVYCYRNDNSRLIGVYDLNEDGTYTIPNLDVNSFYDIVFKDQNRKIENISSSYRNPKAY